MSGLRKVEVTITKDREPTVISTLQQNVHVSCLVALQGFNTTVLQFFVASERLASVLNDLDEIECGSSYGLVVVLPITAIKPRFDKVMEAEPSSRLAIEEVYDRVSHMADPGFNEYVFLAVAASIAAIGLMFDSTTTVISSMLLSPLMDPLVGVIFGTVIRDLKLFWSGLTSFFYGAVFVLLIGYGYGLGFANWSDALNWPTGEMASRGTYTSLISGCFVAFPSGIAVALCVTNGGVNPLVGAAIAASILPPVVNAGVCWARSSIGMWVSDTHALAHFAVLGGYSLGLFVVNVILIFIAGCATFRLKAVVRPKAASDFYTEIPAIAAVPQHDRPWNRVKANLPRILAMDRGQPTTTETTPQINRPIMTSPSGFQLWPQLPVITGKPGHRRTRSLFDPGHVDTELRLAADSDSADSESDLRTT